MICHMMMISLVEKWYPWACLDLIIIENHVKHHFKVLDMFWMISWSTKIVVTDEYGIGFGNDLETKFCE